MALAPREEKSLDRRRLDAFVRIGQNMLGTSLAAGIPTPALETGKMIGIAAADAWMFWDIYKIYNDEKLTAQKLGDMLGTAGIVVMTGGVVSYAALKVSQGLIGEFLNAMPIVGWIASGAMTGTSTMMLGLAWTAYIESQYRADNPKLADEKKPKKKAIKKKKVSVSIGDGKPAEAVNGNGTGHAEDIAEMEPLVEPKADQDSEAIHENEIEAVTDLLDELEAAQRDVDQPEEPASAASDVKPLPGDLVYDTDTVEVTTDLVATADDAVIITMHPEGKEGAEMTKMAYDMVKAAILESVAEYGEITFQDLIGEVDDKVDADSLDKSVRWYVTQVKLDLEAREVIERVPDKSPQHVRLV